MQAYTELLKKYHLKVTPQRLKILSIIDTMGHIGIDQLFEQVRQVFPTVSLATIYKNINQMIESNLVQEVKVPDAKSVYEIAKEPHVHLVCEQCQKIEDIRIEVDPILQEAQKRSGYIIYESFLTLRGLCLACQKQ